MNLTEFQVLREKHIDDRGEKHPQFILRDMVAALGSVYAACETIRSQHDHGHDMDVKMLRLAYAGIAGHTALLCRFLEKHGVTPESDDSLVQFAKAGPAPHPEFGLHAVLLRIGITQQNMIANRAPQVLAHALSLWFMLEDSCEDIAGEPFDKVLREYLHHLSQVNP